MGGGMLRVRVIITDSMNVTFEIDWIMICGGGFFSV